MVKNNIQQWQDFKVGKLFDIHPTKAYKLTNKDLFHENGSYPVVVNSSYNNGIGGYSNLPVTENGNKITFSDTTTAESIFYQTTDFIGYPHVQGLYPIEYKENWSELSLLFFATVFRKSALTQNFDYVNKFTRDLAKALIVRLPVDSVGNPDFSYMEKYMGEIMKKQQLNLDALKKVLVNK